MGSHVSLFIAVENSKGATGHWLFSSTKKEVLIIRPKFSAFFFAVYNLNFLGDCFDTTFFPSVNYCLILSYVNGRTPGFHIENLRFYFHLLSKDSRIFRLRKISTREAVATQKEKIVD